MNRKLLIVIIAAVGLVSATVVLWRSSPVFRYRVLQDPDSFAEAFTTLRKGDTVAHVRSVLGEKYFDTESVQSVREGFRGLGDSVPVHNAHEYQDADAVFAYATDDAGRYGIQFRNGRIVQACYQKGPKVEPARDSDSGS